MSDSLYDVAVTYLFVGFKMAAADASAYFINTFRLAISTKINHIKIWCFLAHWSYKYYIEVSVDEVEWDRVIDRTEYVCRAGQYLYFAARAVKFIRLVYTHATSHVLKPIVSVCMHFNLSHYHI